MAILNASDFTGNSDTYAVPGTNSSVLYSGSIEIRLSTGITAQVSDSLNTAIRCIHYMDRNN
eukprot:10131854-Heterocapsa_arctica.AAC.1